MQASDSYFETEYRIKQVIYYNTKYTNKFYQDL